MEKLAIFDVDFTLTKRETLLEFYLFLLKKTPKLLAHFPRSMGGALLYALKMISAQKAKENFIRFIDGMEEEKMKELVKEFYEKRITKILYKDAIEMIQKLKKQGCKIYLISASAEFYLEELYAIPEVDKIIGTKFHCYKGLHSSKIQGENCKGEEKVRRLMQELEKENIEVDFKNSYMFSDSLSDLPLLNLVGHPYLINYKKKQEHIEILKWK